MRLTLRTLLAYLDDILEPAHTKEIGTKIAENELATTLVNRIREVMRRRRLTAPSLDESETGLDPNTTAEYLDNTLTPDEVVEVEKLCLGSDVHLAEVAACHQILTLVLGEPVSVTPESRKQVYALARTKDSISSATSDVEEIADDDVPVESGSKTFRLGSMEEPADTESSTVSVPDYLKSKPLWRRAFPYLAAAALLAIWLGSLFLGPGRNWNTAPSPIDVAGRKAADDIEPDAAMVEPSADEPAVVGEGTAGKSGGLLEPTDEPDDEANAVVANPDASDQGPAVAVLPATPKNAPGNKTAKVENPDATAKPVAADNPVQPPPDGGPPNQVASKPPKPDSELAAANPNVNVPPKAVAEFETQTLEYVSPEGVLLRYDESTLKDWAALRREVQVKPGDRLAAPAPFQAALDVGDGIGLMTLHSEANDGTSVVVLEGTPSAHLGFELKQGRVTIEAGPNSTVDNPAGKAVSVRVRAKDEDWSIALLTPGTRCGIEMTPQQPEGFEKPLGADWYVGALYVHSGTVAFADKSGRLMKIDEHEWISLTPSDRGSLGDKNNPVPAQKMLNMPHWLLQGDEATSPEAARLGHLFEKHFEVDAELNLNLPALVKNKRVKLSELAVKALAVTNSYQSLVEALATAPRSHHETRVAAIVGLRTWLADSPGNKELLKNELLGYFDPETGEVDTIYRLLWGFGKDDARDIDASVLLVRSLANELLPVREIAYYHFYRLTGNSKREYLPHFNDGKRRSAVNRLLERVERKGGLLGSNSKP